jgi:hypothetical protein
VWCYADEPTTAAGRSARGRRISPGFMPAVKSSTLWFAYFGVYAIGFAGLMYLTRSVPPGWATMSLPFAFPVILVAIAGLAAHAEADEPPRQEPAAVSLLGRAVGRIQREPWRSTTWVAIIMANPPLFVWMFPPDRGFASIRLIFTGWWLASAAFTGFVLPRILDSSRH